MFSIKKSQISSSTSLKADLSLTKLNLIDLAMTFQQETGVGLSSE